jgi:hypothetical protein
MLLPLLNAGGKEERKGKKRGNFKDPETHS